MKAKKLFVKQNIPNMLLILRMILVPVIVGLLIADFFVEDSGSNPIIYHLITPFNTDYHYTNIHLFFLLAGIFFVIASITDWLDGKIARKHQWVTDFGKLWDPIADKVLINSVLICFSAAGYIPIFVPIIMIARDVCVDAQRMVAASKGIVIAANFWGKLKTVLQMVGVILIFFLFNAQYGNLDPSVLGVYWGIQNLMTLLATVISVVSGVIYFVDINKEMKKKYANKN